tara:strand:+ start:4706 stop:5701 length:996 start_codon:yes stop_codon:yes gene_type:complete
MPTRKAPRSGSMQFWPRKRAQRAFARVRTYPNNKGKDDNNVKVLGFAGYKAGMTHVVAKDNKATSLHKGQDIIVPVTVVECPPLKAASLRFYNINPDTQKQLIVGEIFSTTLDKELARRILIPKKAMKKVEDFPEFTEVRLGVYTQPKLTGFGKKKPDLFEIGLAGKKEEQLEAGKALLGKEIAVQDIFSPGSYVDSHAVTTGKGFQGPVKRFGIKIRARKSEKTKRGPGSLGPWVAQGHIMYRVPKAGKMGYHQRMEHNKIIMKIGEDPKEVNPKGGFVNYGLVKNPYLLVKGSLAGPKKRLIRFTFPRRVIKNADVFEVQNVSLDSKQR